jgi:hypothetical protein
MTVEVVVVTISDTVVTVVRIVVVVELVSVTEIVDVIVTIFSRNLATNNPEIQKNLLTGAATVVVEAVTPAHEHALE